MSLDKHSFGDGAALTWDVPVLRPLLLDDRVTWSLTLSGYLSFCLARVHIRSGWPQLVMRCALGPDPFTLAQWATVHTRNSGGAPSSVVRAEHRLSVSHQFDSWPQKLNYLMIIYEICYLEVT